MELAIEQVVRDGTSCNFCQRGILKENAAAGFVYPYDAVLTFKRESSGLKPAICESCLDELYTKGKELLNPMNHVGTFSMSKAAIRTPQQALLYMAECQLATVTSLAIRKKRGKYEYKRQIDIAQTCIDQIQQLKISKNVNSRAYTVISRFGGKVEDWAKHYEPKE